jgi:hypothetical protein
LITPRSVAAPAARAAATSSSLSERGQHDHRQVAPSSDPAAQLEPVDSRKHDVEHDERRRLALQDLPCARSVGRLGRAIPVTLEISHHDVSNDGFVVDDEHGCHGRSLTHM